MTESTFPFAAADDEPEKADRRKLVLGAGVGALVVAALGYFVVVPAFGGGGDSASSEALVVRRRPPATAPKKPAAKPAAKKPAQPATYADISARTDPFKPLIAEPVVAPPAPAGPAAPVPGGTTGGTSGGGTTAPGGTQSGSSTTVGAQRVALVTIYAKDGKSYAQTKVGDTVYTPVVGEVFAGTYKLLAVSGKQATYLYGDEQFTLSVGQEVLK